MVDHLKLKLSPKFNSTLDRDISLISYNPVRDRG